MPLRHQHKERFWLVMAGLLPLLLCLLFTLLEARQMVKRQQAATAEMLLSQAENISDMAWKMNDRLKDLGNSHCEDLKEALQRMSTIDPYFRSVGMTRNEVIFCSSAFGGLHDRLENVIRQPLPLPRPQRWTHSISGTLQVPDRPAVIYLNQLPNNMASYALVDGQYILDFMRAAGMRYGYQIALRFGNGEEIVNGRRVLSHWGNNVFAAHSASYPVTVTITAPRDELLQSRRQVLFTFLPMAAILSLLFIALTSNWLKRKDSFRDEIKRGIERGEFSVHYQPVLELASGGLSGAEALLRWQRADGSWVRPDVFIAAAEDGGLIMPLTRHLLKLVARDAARWQLDPNFHLGINVAADHLQHADFIADIRLFLREIAHLQPALTLELTERSLIRDGKEVARKLSTLRAEGVFIAIDDFGTGYCSLSQLQTFPLDYLKIDRGFVMAIESSSGETPILDAIIQLAQRLALNLVAEGVETATQFSYLKNHGVGAIQGFYYAPPMSNEEFMAWVEQQKTGRSPS